jgi:hypothetical protein
MLPTAQFHSPDATATPCTASLNTTAAVNAAGDSTRSPRCVSEGSHQRRIQLRADDPCCESSSQPFSVGKLGQHDSYGGKSPPARPPSARVSASASPRRSPSGARRSSGSSYAVVTASRAANSYCQARLARVDRIMLQEREREGRHRILTVEEDIFVDHLIPYYQLLCETLQSGRTSQRVSRHPSVAIESPAATPSLSPVRGRYPTLTSSAPSSAGALQLASSQESPTAGRRGSRGLRRATPKHQRSSYSSLSSSSRSLITPHYETFSEEHVSRVVKQARETVGGATASRAGIASAKTSMHDWRDGGNDKGELSCSSGVTDTTPPSQLHDGTVDSPEPRVPTMPAVVVVVASSHAKKLFPHSSALVERRMNPAAAEDAPPASARTEAPNVRGGWTAPGNDRGRRSDSHASTTESVLSAQHVQRLQDTPSTPHERSSSDSSRSFCGDARSFSCTLYSCPSLRSNASQPSLETRESFSPVEMQWLSFSNADTSSDVDEADVDTGEVRTPTSFTLPVNSVCTEVNEEGNGTRESSDASVTGGYARLPFDTTHREVDSAPSSSPWHTPRVADGSDAASYALKVAVPRAQSRHADACPAAGAHDGNVPRCSSLVQTPATSVRFLKDSSSRQALFSSFSPLSAERKSGVAFVETVSRASAIAGEKSRDTAATPPSSSLSRDTVRCGATGASVAASARSYGGGEATARFRIAGPRSVLHSKMTAAAVQSTAPRQQTTSSVTHSVAAAELSQQSCRPSRVPSFAYTSLKLPCWVGSLSALQAEESVQRAILGASEFYEWSHHLLPMMKHVGREGVSASP